MAGTATSVSSMGTNWVSQVFEDALAVFRSRNVMGSLVTTFTDRSGDEARANSVYNQLTAGTVAETTDLTSELEHTKANIATLSVAEVGVISFLTDRRRETDQQNALADLSQELGESLADKVEADLLGDLASLTAGTIGTAGSVLGWNHLFAARAVLAGKKVPGPYVCVLHEHQWFNLAKSASVAASQTNASAGLLDDVNSRYYVGTFGGIDIFTTANIAAGTAISTGMWNRQAIAIDWRRAPRLEPQRDASRRGVELVMTSKYAHGVWRPLAGVKLIGDASVPTG